MVKAPGWRRTRDRFYDYKETGRFINFEGVRVRVFQCERCKEEWPKPVVQIHHLNPACYRPDLVHRFENLIILCRKCHDRFTQDLAIITEIEKEFDLFDPSLISSMPREPTFKVEWNSTALIYEFLEIAQT